VDGTVLRCEHGGVQLVERAPARRQHLARVRAGLVAADRVEGVGNGGGVLRGLRGTPGSGDVVRRDPRTAGVLLRPGGAAGLDLMGPVGLPGRVEAIGGARMLRAGAVFEGAGGREEVGTLDRGGAVDGASTLRRIVRDDRDGAAAEESERGDERLAVERLQTRGHSVHRHGHRWFLPLPQPHARPAKLPLRIRPSALLVQQRR